MMKAVRINAFGGSDQVQLENVGAPVIGKDEALVSVRAAGVNPIDWMIREKIYNPEGTDRVPLTLGQDFSGVIEKIAPGTDTELRPGDEVFGEAWGTFADYVAVPVSDLVRKPRTISFATAASIPMPGLTAWQLVHAPYRGAAGALRGKRFLIHGASGGVGSFAAQFAKLEGAEVIATASPTSFDYLEEIGVDRVIDYHNERFENLVKGIDVVVDPQGGDVQVRSWNVLRKGGTLINLIGEIDGERAKQAGVKTIEFEMRYDVNDLRKIIQLVEAGKVRPHISKVLPIEQARHALDLNQQGQSHGKIILKVA
jgi:NADPH:quinone reductase-like Zn-dependent oxidoreductase